MAEWRTIVLEDGLEKLIDYRGKSPPKSPSGVPVISAKVVKNGRIVFPIEQRISPEYYPIWMTRGLPEQGDVVLTTEGPLGEVAQLTHETAGFALGQRVVCLRGKRGVLDSTFLKFLLLSPTQQAILEGFATGTTVAGISQKALRGVPITIPRHQQQVVIGRLLGALDDKIDLNRRMNETLEAMARAIFRDWFVDFGPTRAKMEGRAPYLAPDLWALFPDRFDAEGKPEAWTQAKLLDLCQLKRGYDLPTKERKSGHVPIISSSGVSGFHDTAAVQGPGVVTGRCGTIGSVFYIEQPFWPLNTSLYVRDFKGNSPRFVFYTLRGIDFAVYSDKGAVPGINRNHLHEAPIIIAGDAVQAAFQETLTPIWQRMALNQSETDALAATRDLLLPKLMSGEIRVRDAEKVLEAAL